MQVLLILALFVIAVAHLNEAAVVSTRKSGKVSSSSGKSSGKSPFSSSSSKNKRTTSESKKIEKVASELEKELSQDQPQQQQQLRQVSFVGVPESSYNNFYVKAQKSAKRPYYFQRDVPFAAISSFTGYDLSFDSDAYDKLENYAENHMQIFSGALNEFTSGKDTYVATALSVDAFKSGNYKFVPYMSRTNDGNINVVILNEDKYELIVRGSCDVKQDVDQIDSNVNWRDDDDAAKFACSLWNGFRKYVSSGDPQMGYVPAKNAQRY
ncbi:hypothetical protein MIR68_002483 [Amoeboaphelidium protococcarum]|nr:hypothetical protein MIR68_002483 [Amoeboaphelidium protococcarum]KAI3654941.1 hypothetical protein MP228_000321 [Amoeboaphelidium protococcarum]